MVNNYEKALEDVVSLGCERILTSGLESSALEGTPTIKKCIELVSRANKHLYIVYLSFEGNQSDCVDLECLWSKSFQHIFLRVTTSRYQYCESVLNKVL